MFTFTYNAAIKIPMDICHSLVIFKSTFLESINSYQNRICANPMLHMKVMGCFYKSSNLIGRCYLLVLIFIHFILMRFDIFHSYPILIY